jgi:hypothetical protein
MTSVFNYNNINDIIDLLIGYKSTRDENLLIKIKTIVGDTHIDDNYDNFYNNFIKSNRDLFFEYSKGYDNLDLWCKLVYKLYDD